MGTGHIVSSSDTVASLATRWDNIHIWNYFSAPVLDGLTRRVVLLTYTLQHH